ncbi:MAG TPA: DUF2795 domain-containing protein [Amycolatopsis sp.]|nr:DUF2795 domain-containing protein [Amycolatopsis sp.]
MNAPSDDRLSPLLSDVDFPCDRAELLRQAAAHGADDTTLGHLSCLPDDSYADYAAVARALAQNV